MSFINKLLKGFKSTGSCWGKKEEAIGDNLNKIAIVGSPDVGKSVMFNCLIGTY